MENILKNINIFITADYIALLSVISILIIIPLGHLLMKLFPKFFNRIQKKRTSEIVFAKKARKESCQWYLNLCQLSYF